jgi:CubicO group peptidase (beta-lactamase class C family)
LNVDVAAAPGDTLALVVRRGGETVFEHWADGVDEHTTLPSWSMAKSILHAAVGVLARDGCIALETASPVAGATVDHLLQMRAGLAWNEDYVPGARSDVQEMLFGAGRSDTAGFTLARPSAHAPGAADAFCYSSGTSNVLSAMVAASVGHGDAYVEWLRDAVLAPAGLHSAIPKLDDAGVWIASSYCFATAMDFARFGELYLRGGDDLLPAGWVRSGTELVSRDEDGQGYGRHWWVWGDELGTFEARGYAGQSITVIPALDTVIVRLGRTELADGPALRAWRRDLVHDLAGE